MAETKIKAPQDYSKSAINLCNPEKVKELLAELHRRQQELLAFEDSIPEGIAYDIARTQELISILNKTIRNAIDEHGSYQDLENEYYAVKYKRISKIYLTEPFKEHYPKFVSVVIREVINTKALEGIIKGGLIEEADLKMHKVITEDVGYAYIVR